MGHRYHYDYLIIGQGLAGSLLAWRLLQARQRVRVIDNANPAAASRVAAGLVNPVSGKRLVREAGVGVYLDAARACYGQLAGQFGQIFFHTLPMLRLFDDSGIREAWQRRRDDRGYADFIGEAVSPAQCGYADGSFFQHQTGYLATAPLLDNLRQWLQGQDALLEEQFDYGELQLGDTTTWRGNPVGKVIFCEGARVVHNPWFAWLPMQPAQGEILTLAMADGLPEWIINGGKWLLPVGAGRCKLGATYVWPGPDRPLDEQPTTAGKQALLAALPRLAPAVIHYEVVQHAAGIRPNSLDKQPLIGFHPQFPQLAVFNGFGSRGSLLIPFFSRHFTDVLLWGEALQATVDIRRVCPP